MRKMFSLMFMFLVFIFGSYCEESNITFEVITDNTINFAKDYLQKDIVNNCLIAKSNGMVLDKYYSANVNILNIDSIEDNFVFVRYTRNTKTQTPSSPFWNYGKIIFCFKNGKFIQVMKYPEGKGSQSGPIFKLIDVDIKNETIKLKYDYQQYGDARAAGFGTAELLFTKLDNGIYFFSNYDFDVYGHFKKTIGYYNSDDKEGYETWVPDENGEEIVKRDISKKELARQFSELLTDIWYDSTKLNDVLFVSENLHLREADNTSSKITTTMKDRTEVRILQIGMFDIIDGFPGNWCYIEIVKDVYKKNERNGSLELVEKSRPTGVKGWCFSAYLK